MSLSLGYESDTEFIDAHFQPALLTELALSRGVEEYHLMRGVRLCLDDLKRSSTRISPDQYLTLIANARRLMGAEDTAFQLGHRLLPGCNGAVSQALQQSINLRQVLEFVGEFHTLLTPLMRLRFYENNEHVFIQWHCSGGDELAQPFLLEANVTALVSMVKWLSGAHLPWQISFAYARPSYEEQYWVHLGSDVQFNQPVSSMTLPKSELERPWPNAAPLGVHGALERARQQFSELGWPNSFVDVVYDHLLANLQRPINLERVADAFDLSSASLKRKLKKNGTHFQAQLDLARAHTALRLHHQYGLNAAQIADHLRFNDMNNFRRAFKRWTGQTPRALLTI